MYAQLKVPVQHFNYIGSIVNIKEFLLPLVFALGITAFIQYYFLQTQQKEQQKTTFTATPTADTQRPLKTEVDFIDTPSNYPVEQTEIETSWALLRFSSEGATLEEIQNKKNINGSVQRITTLASYNPLVREGKCFLVGLDDRTPYDYQLVDHSSSEQNHQLVYKAACAQGTLTKTFIIDAKLPKIDLLLAFESSGKSDVPLRARIFLPAPRIDQLGENDTVSAISVDAKGLFEKKQLDTVPADRGWLAPHIFGADDRYFVHALISDVHHFTERSYYRSTGIREGFAILEGPAVSKSATWPLTFYMGQKDSDVMASIDPRLDQTLDYYGYFSPVSKGLLWILKLLYSYVHNYGLAIILITLLLKLIMLPLTIRSEASMRQQKEMQKKIAQLEHRYKDNPEMLNQERAELMRKNGVSMLGGCLPMLLQIPVFFALSRLLAHSIELYKAPMLWIPDLSSKDPLYIFPLLVTVGMLSNAVSVDDKQKMSVIAMALVFGALTASFPAGLALYITVNTFLGMVQTYVLTSIRGK